MTIIIALGYSMAMLSPIQKNYASLHRVDYIVQDYAASLKSDLLHVKEIQYSNDFSFYLAEGLQFEAAQKNMRVTASVLEDTGKLYAGLLITRPGTNLQNENYKEVIMPNDFFEVYIRKDIATY